MGGASRSSFLCNNAMNTKEFRDQLLAEYANIMNFWIGKMEDHEYGGFYGGRDKEGDLIPNAEKGAILNARILWAFSCAARLFGRPEYKEGANRAFCYLRDFFYDKKNGGFYWSLDAKGAPVDTKKQAYAQGFCIYGLSEYYRLTQDPQAIDLAYETYHLIETHFRDPNYGGYIEALAADWTPMEDVRLSDKDENTPKSMNTHLHIIEPYANLYRAKPTPELRDSIIHCLDIFTSKIICSVTGHFNLFFGMDWTVMSHIDSYGHDIEGSWLLYEAAEVIDDKEWMEKLKPICKRLTDVTIAEGWDCNSIFYEKVNGKLDTDKHWWPQAEAMVGLADTWRLTGEQSYLDKVFLVWDFIREHIIDRKRGEWLWRTDRNGADVYPDCKAGFWKCPYHNTRALAEVLARVCSYNR